MALTREENLLGLIANAEREVEVTNRDTAMVRLIDAILDNKRLWLISRLRGKGKDKLVSLTFANAGRSIRLVGVICEWISADPDHEKTRPVSHEEAMQIIKEKPINAGPAFE